jgi:hypothetical protein
VSVKPRLAALGLALALHGCGGALVREDWLPHPTHPQLEPRHVEVSADILARVCGQYPGLVLYGCAVRELTARTCYIYTTPRPAAWLMEHERKHCAGWDHGPFAPSGGVATATRFVEPAR